MRRTDRNVKWYTGKDDSSTAMFLFLPFAMWVFIGYMVLSYVAK